jgi:hypothetical protein
VSNSATLAAVRNKGHERDILSLKGTQIRHRRVFHGKIGYANAPQCYVTGKFLVFLFMNLVVA